MEFIGIEPERVQFSWVSAGEGEKFANIITKVTEDIKRIGPAKRMVKYGAKPVELKGAVK